MTSDSAPADSSAPPHSGASPDPPARFRFSVADLAVDERRELAQFLRTLTAEQWEVRSLCADWTVRQVVAHAVSYEEAGPLTVVGRFARGGFRLSGANAVSLQQHPPGTPEQLIDHLERNLRPRGLTTMFGSRVALLDALVHNQDIRRPLGLPREIPTERLIPSLNFARFAPPIAAYPRIRGLRMIATDIDWSAGHGLDVYGPAEVLLMAITGRNSGLDQLAGPGLPTLLSRMRSAPRSRRTMKVDVPSLKP